MTRSRPLFGRILLGSFVIAVGIAGVVRLAGAPAPPMARSAGPLHPASNEQREENEPPVTRPENLRREVLPASFEALKPLARPKGPPGPDDWLTHHAEPGQSLADWRASSPVEATEVRRTIYLQPLGTFTPRQQDVVAKVADYLGRYFGVTVRTRAPMSLSLVPTSATRLNPHEGQPQVLTTWVLPELIQRRPDDALAYIALTPVDLYPHETWNFVYGQATLQERVGVWSMWRFGDPDESEAAFNHALRRTIAVAVHELGHMLTIAHCIAWECVMNGVNHDEEADAAPLEPCPTDLAKLCAATACDPARRFNRLIQFWERHPTVSPETLQHLRAARTALSRGTEVP